MPPPKVTLLPKLPSALAYFDVVYRAVPVESKLALPLEAVGAENRVLDEPLNEVAGMYV